MGKPMGRPKVIEGDVVLLQVKVPWEEAAELNAVAEAAGVSRASLVRTLLSYGLRAYTQAWIDTEATPTPRRKQP